jgi:type IV secretory pathway TrbD component
MHCITIDNPTIFSNRSGRRLRLQRLALRQWLLTFRAVALRTLCEVASVMILILIPWNTADFATVIWPQLAD